MADISIYAGSTSQSIDVFIPDSSSTTGQGLSGLAYNTTTFKDSVYYRKSATGSPVKITLATLANAQAAWSSGGFAEIDATNMKGWYRLDVPDAMISSSGFVHLFLGAGTNVAPVCMRVNCSALPVDLKAWLGAAPNSLIQGKVDSLQHIHTGTAQAGGSQTITLASGASSVDNYYAGQWIIILAGTGAGQAAVRISSYVGSSRVATITTISGAWKTQPDDTSMYAILPSSYIGVDWGDMIRQTTTQGLSGTTIGTVTAISDSRIDNLDATVSTRASEVNASANRITILAAIPGVSAIAAACWAYVITGSTSAATALSYVFSVVSSLVGSGGANSVTITVNDGATAIQSASVSAWSGSTLVATGTTNVSGVVILSLNSATYSINITANGFNGSAGNSLVVSGATSQTYSLTAITITPSDPPEVTGYLYCYDQFGNAQAGVPHTIVLQTAPSGDTGASLSQRPRTVVSASDGLVEFTGLVQEAVYTVKRADGPQTRFTADTTTFAITDLAG